MSSLPSSGTVLFKKLNPDKQEKVLQAAVREFAFNGYRNASMNTVVKTAGISKGSLFQYFKTKRDLFAGVVELAEDQVRRYLKQVRDDTRGMGFFDRIEQLVQAGFAFIDNHPLLARIYFHLLHSGEAPSGAQRVKQLRKQGDGFLCKLMLEAVNRGELDQSIDIERVAFLINCLLETLLRAYYTAFLASDLGLYKGDPEELGRWVKTTLDLISQGIGAKQDTALSENVSEEIQ